MTPQHQVKFFYVFDVLYFMTHYLTSIHHKYATSSFHICPPKYCGKTGRKTYNLLPPFISNSINKIAKRPFKYYVIKEVSGWGQKMAIFDWWVGLKKSKP